MGDYVSRLRNGATAKAVHDDIVARLYRQHAEDGVGQMGIGLLPSGGQLVYRQAFFGEDSTVEVFARGRSRLLHELETPDLIAALVVIDRKFQRRGVA